MSELANAFYHQGKERGLTVLARQLTRGTLPALRMPEPAFCGNLEWDTAWATTEPWEGQYIHAYDKKHAYLSALASGSDGFGAGELIHTKKSHDLPPGRVARGYFFASIETPMVGLPSPFRPDGDETPTFEANWHTTPIVQLAQAIGATIRIHESWTWTGRKRPLEKWCKVVLEARRALDDPARWDDDSARLRALAELKIEYGRFFSYLASIRPEGWAPDPLFRPDIRHAVIAQTRANQYHNLRKLTAQDRLIAISVDCLYFASDLPDAEAARPEGLRTGTAATHYRVKHSGVPAAVVRAAIAEGGSDRIAIPRACREHDAAAAA